MEACIKKTGSFERLKGEIHRGITSIENGFITLVVQDGTVIQINLQENYSGISHIKEREKSMVQVIKKYDNVSEMGEDDVYRIMKLAQSIKFGSVTVIINDKNIVQVEKNEKCRLV